MQVNIFPATNLRASPYATYDDAHIAGVVTLAVASLLSGVAVLVICMVILARSSSMHVANVVPYFASLLIANLFQSVGTAINLKWVDDRAVTPGMLCSVQGGLKQAGNVGMALWSFVLSLHVFHILFLRWKPLKVTQYLVLGFGWAAVIIVVIIGPLAIQDESKGPYFGPSGHWCWITNQYPMEQTYLEYFFEFLSAGLCFFMYTAVLLRVRGNLVRTNERWLLRFVPRGERWQLAVTRDSVDDAMLRVAALMVWYPVAYTMLLLPVSIARLVEFSGHSVPFWATITTATIFNLQGLVNVVLLASTRNLFPQAATLDDLSKPRKTVDFSSPEAYGITPYILPPREQKDVEAGLTLREGNVEGLSRTDTVDSRTPLTEGFRRSIWRPFSFRN